MIEERIAITDGCLYNEETGEACISAKFGQKIVRCKDCKYFHENVFGDEIGIGAPYDILIVGHCGCSRLAGDKDMIYMEPDGFCSLGERREEDE